MAKCRSPALQKKKSVAHVGKNNRCPDTIVFYDLLGEMVFLSALLSGARSVPGKQWIGKHRKVLKMTATRRRNQNKRQSLIDDVCICIDSRVHRHSILDTLYYLLYL